MTKQDALEVINQKQDLIIEVSDTIWDYAELSLLEKKSAAFYIQKLKDEGFDVQTPVAGMDTAFLGRVGSGRPIIGILAEYDALDGLSQQGGMAERRPIEAGKPGHGCHHHALGAGSFGAALAVKAYLESKPEGSGTLVFYGTPGEEGGAGKAFMARDGVFDELDIAFCWHPGSTNEVTTGTCNSSLQIEYKFTGVSAHAAGDPHLGRSALDAVELMNVGVQFLREHMIDSARIHYAITDAGGYSPNVVQPEAQVLYMVRSQKVGQALDLLKRLDKIAEGAALMTETTLKRRFIDGTSNTVPNFTLEKLLYDNFAQIGVPSYTEEEKALAAALIKTYENPRTVLPGFAANQDPEIGEYVKSKIADGRPLNDFLVPYYSSTAMRMGSTDVGDVSWICPTAQITTVTQASNSPGHSWQNVAIGNTSIAHKGVLCASRVLAGAAIDIYENPDIVAAAKAEWEKKLGGESYRCPIPADAVPIAVGDKM
jgi:aminobenzoyl-glutamate utilization protein B